MIRYLEGFGNNLGRGILVICEEGLFGIFYLWVGRVFC